MTISIKNIQQASIVVSLIYKEIMEKTPGLPIILIYCEGGGDKKFVNSIKNAYGNSKSFKIVPGNGGSQEEILDGCIKVEGEFERYCVIDAIPKIKNETRRKAKKNEIKLVEVKPYLECVILNVLENNTFHNKGFNKNTAKDKLKKMIKSEESLENLFSKHITKKLLIERKNLLGNFRIILDLFEKYKQTEQTRNNVY